MTRKQARARALHRQIARIDRRLAFLTQTSSRYAAVRLAIFLVGGVSSLVLGIAVAAWASLIGGLAWMVAFVIAAHYHGLVKEALRRYTIWRAIKAAHIARMELNWSGLPPALFRLPREDFPLESDLDLVGERSLHRLIDTSASWEGSLRLRDWLAATTPDLERTRSRQALVRELAARAAFRDRLAYHARRASQGTFRHWEGERLQNWLSEHALSEMPSLPLRGLTLLAAVNAILFIVAQAAHTLPFWALTFLPYVGWYLWKVWELRDPFETSLALLDPLNDLRAVFETLETYGYGRAERLRELCAPFLEHDRRPSDEVRRLTRVLAAASLRGNPLLWMLISMILPWDVYVACWLNKRRVALGALLPGWLDRWFELEALNGLATLAYLNPDYTYPEWIEDEVQVRPVFEARELGHPLIPEDRCVCNDFSLDALGEMALISGSNMSGKSTFLRTLGVNLCLANAGAPVNARLFRAVPFRLFSCIRVTDSVTDGISYFYAEVKRLKALLMALQQDHPFPLFFLIDEIFRGTNNRERMIGSRSYIRALVGQHGTGAISTHDLELVKLADELARIVNYHFAETIADGRMLFDYTLRAGPCPTTNALRIMRMEGLPVEPAGPDS